MNANAKTLAIDAVAVDERVVYCRLWGLALVLGSLASWALVIAAARLIVSVV